MSIAIITGAIAAIAEVAGVIMEAAKVVGAVGSTVKMLCEIGQCLGILPSDMDFSDIGAHVYQAEKNGIKPENFSDYEEYEKMVESLEVDPDIRKMPIDQLNRKALEYELYLLNQKYPDITLESIRDTMKTIVEHIDYFSTRFNAMKKLGFVSDPQALVNIADALLTKDFDKIDEVYETYLIPIEKKLQPGITDAEAKKKIVHDL